MTMSVDLFQEKPGQTTTAPHVIPMATAPTWKKQRRPLDIDEEMPLDSEGTPAADVGSYYQTHQMMDRTNRFLGKIPVSSASLRPALDLACASSPADLPSVVAPLGTSPTIQTEFGSLRPTPGSPRAPALGEPPPIHETLPSGLFLSLRPTPGSPRASALGEPFIGMDSSTRSPSEIQRRTPTAPDLQWPATNESTRSPTVTQRRTPTLPPLATNDVIPPAVLRNTLDSILRWKTPAPGTPEFCFDFDSAAAKHNLVVLRRYDMDLDRAIRSQPFSAMTYGSEFRPTTILAPLFGRHHLWPRVCEYLTNGVDHPLRPISEEERLRDLRLALKRGNHKSAMDEMVRLKTMLRDEVHRMWQLPLPLSAVTRLPGCAIAPLGMALQDTINEFGETVPKWRITHDQTFEVEPGAHRSVNHRVEFDELTQCQFGTALLRYIHLILHQRRCCPHQRILQTKVDLKAAYRRLHQAATTAVRSMVQVDGMLLLSLRLTFGGAPNPSMWSDASEMAFDAANDIVRHPGWDPSTQHSPHQHLIAGKIESEPDDVPLAQSLPVIVDMPPDLDPKCDGYIDDAFMSFLEEHLERGSAILPLVIELLGRPVHASEETVRDDLLSLKKFLAEATPAEIKMILGWAIDTRRLLISLPDDKCIAWSRAIQTMLDSGRATVSDLETTVGRLNHCGFVIPTSRHFLSRLRGAERAARHRRVYTLPKAVLLDLRLWLQFLQHANQGISLNLLSYRQPTHIMRQDACEHGIGGVSLTSCFGWRWEIPLELQGRATLNTLEFMAAYVSVRMELAMTTVEPHSVLLSQGDSTSATGWLRKSNFDDEIQPLQLLLARALATTVLNNTIGLYGQWFPGDENDVSDSCSRDHHLSDAALVLLLHSCVPEQVPPGFSICQLPDDLVSELTSWLLNLPRVKQPQRRPRRSKHGTGRTTQSICRTSSSHPTTHSSKTSTTGNGPKSCVPLPQPTAMEPSTTNGSPNQNLPLQAALQLYLARSAPPSTQWLRPTGLTGI